MEKVKFFSYMPYLTLSFGYMGAQFDQNNEFTTSNDNLIQILRNYAERCKHYYNIVESGKGVSLEELITLHNKAEQQELEKAEKRQQERLIKEAEERKEKELIDALKSRF